MNFQILIIIILILSSCNPSIVPIEYGKEDCHNCKMTIVDNQHACERVTSKGKAYKYDAIECMVRDIQANPKEFNAFIVVNNYSKPGELIHVDTAVFLISPTIQSPMGANLSAFSQLKDAEKYLNDETSKIYGWDELLHVIH